MRDTSLLLGKYTTVQDTVKLCHLLLRREEYVNNYTLVASVYSNNSDHLLLTSRYADLTILKPFVTSQHLHTNQENLIEKTLRLKVFSCSKYKLKGTPTKLYKILAGPDESSVILIEPIRYKEKVHLVPVELIKNLHWDYVFHFEDWF